MVIRLTLLDFLGRQSRSLQATAQNLSSGTVYRLSELISQEVETVLCNWDVSKNPAQKTLSALLNTL